MEKIELNRLMDLLEDIKKIDSMILLHQSLDDSNFMTSQYQSKKIELVGKFIDDLISLNIQSAHTFSLIQKVISKYYPSIGDDDGNFDDEMSQLSQAI
ncbi:hypothetical protein [Chitinophaga sp. Cy-1792]|uniref:hypothetical protein n=1 Tax=Chitinophaga sp. Cy-1792 TaxID=2608339 RepID=UPI00141EA545|nr:hypothetical protein [Chitinophaga sp. Cy-1792]NIG54777.1 hypothetical protein [Chitinophaga sp. Cy-1792]